jgi:uridylate kinase
MENDLPIVVFDLDAHENILRAVKGEEVGTIISKEGTR